jgi:cell wall-associated NlpC family hydrolase
LFIPAVDDGWAVLAQPPGLRDLALPDHWDFSLGRSRRRREARRSKLCTFGVQRASAALAALTVTTSAVAVVGAEPAAAASIGMLHKGSHGPDVAALQAKLGVAADGAFGPITRRAVKNFQRDHGLEVDGIVGPITAGALGLTLHAGGATQSVESADAAPAALSLSRSSTMALQSALGVSADGAIGPITRHAIRSAERSHGLPVDGKPDADLLAALGVDASSAPAPLSSSSGGSGAAAAVSAARSMIGVPYASAGTTTSGFDCSGLTMWAFKQAGISLPRTSYDQYGVGTAVSKSSVAAGDLVFFDTSGGGASHVGIATSGSTAISATTHGVMEHSIDDSYWGAHYVGARRV